MLNNIGIYVFENDTVIRNARKILNLLVNITNGGLSKELPFLPPEERDGLLVEIIC